MGIFLNDSDTWDPNDSPAALYYTNGNSLPVHVIKFILIPSLLSCNSLILMEVIRLQKSRISHAKSPMLGLQQGRGRTVQRAGRDSYPLALTGTELQGVSLELLYSANSCFRKIKRISQIPLSSWLIWGPLCLLPFSSGRSNHHHTHTGSFIRTLREYVFGKYPGRGLTSAGEDHRPIQWFG